MPDLSVILLLTCATVISSVISRTLPSSIPMPLIQIAIGYLLALSGGFNVTLNPDLFFFLFLPPLLFLDAWRIQKRGFFDDIGGILNLSLGLVIFTVLGLGFLVHWLIPAIPLPAAFALAAIVSPTDPVAVSAISRTVPIPKRLMHILEGESLLNDASGLVCMRFAVAAAASGTFSLSSASLSFLWVALGGLAIGAVVSGIASFLNSFVAVRLGEHTGSQILFSLLIPFAAYYLAEEAETSGVLAAVAAGIVMSYAEMRDLGLATTRIRRNAIWDTLQFALNGAMFVLLGEQLPHIFEQARNIVTVTGHQQPYWLAIYVVVVMLALALLRFAWVWMSLRLMGRKVQFRLVVATAFAGARGAITLAGVLSIPVVMSNGQPFPERDIIIFIAACVIILSLILAAVGLPFALRGITMPDEPLSRQQEQAARTAAKDAALATLDEVRKHASPEDSDFVNRSVDRISALYQEHQAKPDGNTTSPEDNAKALQIEKNLWLLALRAERRSINADARARRLNDDTARKLVSEIDLLEARIAGE